MPTVSGHRSSLSTSILDDLEDDSREAEIALFEAASYVCKQLKMDAVKISKILKIPVKMIKGWFSTGRVSLKEGLSGNDVERLIHLIAIHRNLEAMFDAVEAQLDWLRTYRPDLGAKPIEKMSSSFQDLLVVRQYLDYMRGRGA